MEAGYSRDRKKLSQFLFVKPLADDLPEHLGHDLVLLIAPFPQAVVRLFLQPYLYTFSHKPSIPLVATLCHAKSPLFVSHIYAENG